ncbi:Gfo/Idh/MocA family oxidoreductase [Microlunatus elymi]|uniref:Gfo/Idh/MocA family oxidoreductase n=1 Tax=Microlunatus elymi TaxID=2596828 RepID=A0A516Q419_9ACTN|nr:Gfo/Idh/MocA family oxidoreductase [Microlunatus elymi]QDP98144.1 Gfo/Idh/MocA family oxidoreductase [Microlunatus elymi]
MRERMIRVGLIGVADPRHRWFLAAAVRRRAGVGIVGLSEPDPVARTEVGDRYDLPTWDDHQAMLQSVRPTLVAVTQPDPGPLVIDALQHGADVLVLPPIADSLAGLENVAAAADATGRRVIAAHTYRGHPATRTVQQLTGRLGRLDVVSLMISGRLDDHARRAAIVEGLDVFRLLTGSTPSVITEIGDGDRLREEDPAELRTGFGELIMVAPADAADAADEEAPVFEVRVRPDTDELQQTIQVVGEGGAVEWDTRTGLMHSAFDGTGGGEPITVSCGHPEPAEWVLNNLIRRRRPLFSTEESLELTRLLLSRSAPVG